MCVCIYYIDKNKQRVEIVTICVDGILLIGFYNVMFIYTLR